MIMPRQKKTTTTTTAKAETAVKAAETTAAKPVAAKPEKPVEVKAGKTAEVKAAPAETPKAARKPAAKTTAKNAAKTTAKNAVNPAAKADSAPKKRAGRKPKPITVNDVVAKVYKRINKAAGKQVAAEGRAAVDIKLYGSFEAHMYIEVKDGKVSVEPYDYIERDLEAAVPVDVALAIADGKTTIKEAVENGSLYVFGNVQFALKFAKLFD